MSLASPASTYVTAQMSHEERAILDRFVEQAKRLDPTTNRNRIIRQWIASLEKHITD